MLILRYTSHLVDMLILSVEELLRVTIYVIVFRNIMQTLLGCDSSRE